MKLTVEQITDIDRLMAWRREVIEHVFGQKPGMELLEANRSYYIRHIANGSHLAIVVKSDGEEIGCGAVCFSDELPSPDNPGGRCGYLMNIYVREPWRHQGIGHFMVGCLLKRSLERKCGKIYLETTSDARTLYTSLGFSSMPDMMKWQQ